MADDTITIEGEVTSAAGADVVVAEAMLDSGGDDAERTLVGHPFVVTTADGRRIDITAARSVAVVPTREVSGPWREIRDHVTRPRSSVPLHDDGHVRLRYGIVAVGDRVCVIGRATGHEFVPDTGGPREPATRELREVEAVVIGVGDAARRDAERRVAETRDAHQRALERARVHADRAARAPLRERRRAVAMMWVVRAVLAAVAVVAVAVIAGLGILVASSNVVYHVVGAWGIWIAVAGCAALPPHRPFPGGAASTTVPATWQLFAIISLVLVLVSFGLPLASAFDDLGSAFAVMNLLAIAATSGIAAAIAIVAQLRRPRARPGVQLALHANPVVRAAVVVADVATFGVATWSLARV